MLNHGVDLHEWPLDELIHPRQWFNACFFWQPGHGQSTRITVPCVWCGLSSQLEAALVLDGVDVLVEGLRAKLDVDELDSWRGTFRRGQVYNEGSPGIHWPRRPGTSRHVQVGYWRQSGHPVPASAVRSLATRSRPHPLHQTRASCTLYDSNQYLPDLLVLCFDRALCTCLYTY